MSSVTTGAYRPGDRWLHRVTPGPKLIGLAAFGIAIVATRGWVSGLVALAIGLVAAGAAGLRARELGRLGRAFAPICFLLFVFQTWQRDWQHGAAVVAGLLALILAASAITASTSIGDMLDTVTRSLRPFTRFGVDPERVALTFSLAIRALPLAFELARDTRAAARARGLDRSPRAFLVPFVVRMVAHSRQTGAALHARGIDD